MVSLGAAEAAQRSRKKSAEKANPDVHRDEPGDSRRFAKTGADFFKK